MSVQVQPMAKEIPLPPGAPGISNFFIYFVSIEVNIIRFDVYFPMCRN